METNKILKGIILGTAVISIAACSSTKNKNAAGGDMAGQDADAYGAGYGSGYGDTYAQGANNNGGYYNDPNCNIPGDAAFYFDFDSNAVHPEDRARIQALAQNANASHKDIRVVGNTDNRGSREYNVALGWRRADAGRVGASDAGACSARFCTLPSG